MKTRSHLLLSTVAPIALLLMASCGDPEATSTDPGDENQTVDVAPVCDPQCGEGYLCVADMVCEVDPAAVCTGGTRWSHGTSAFREVTAEWGLDGVQATRLSVTDIDGDGWPDLHLRRQGIRWDDSSEGGTRHNWLLRNTGSGTFEDVTQSSGLLATNGVIEGNLGRAGEVVAWADVDNDGDLDVYTGFNTTDPEASRGELSELMLNEGDGSFVFGPASSQLRRSGLPDVPAGASFADVDRDGFVDVWIGQHNYTPPGESSLVFMQDRLYLGDGSGGFADVTTERGLTTVDWRDIADLNGARAHTRSWGTTACDLNNDGTPDLLSPAYGRSPNHLWVGQGTGAALTYANQSVASGYGYDDDLTWQDNQFAACYCESSPTAEGCDGATTPLIMCSTPSWSHQYDRELFRLGGNSGATSCSDVDNDGDMDLLTGEIRHWWAGSGADGSELLINQGGADPVFERPSDEALGMAIEHGASNWDEGHMTNTTFDFDNDGWQDIYIGASDYAGNRGLLYHQDSSLAFSEVPTTDFFEHNRSHGVVVADFDRDGDLDIIVGHSRSRCDATAPNDCYETPQLRAFENTLGQDGNWIQLRLEGGEGTNRAAIGARVSVTAGGVTQTQEVSAGSGHYGSQNDLVLHFGLGTACEASVQVRWPDAALTTQSFDVVSGHGYAILQGEDPTPAW